MPPLRARRFIQSACGTPLQRFALLLYLWNGRHQIWLTVARGGLCVVEDEAMCVRAVFTAMKQGFRSVTVGMPSLGAPMTDDDVCASRGFRLLVAGVIQTDKGKKRRLHAENPTEFIKRVLRENPPMIPTLVHCKHVMIRWLNERANWCVPANWLHRPLWWGTDGGSE